MVEPDFSQKLQVWAAPEFCRYLLKNVSLYYNVLAFALVPNFPRLQVAIIGQRFHWRGVSDRQGRLLRVDRFREQ